FIFISSIITFNLDEFFMNTIYTVSCIMFSIGIGLVTTFNLQGIKNKLFIERIRRNLNSVRNSYIKYFTISTFVFVKGNYIRTNQESVISYFIDKTPISLDLSLLFCLIIFFSTSYYVLNFVSLQKLNNEIYDNIHN